ncbi:MAG: hypothetical protein NTX25_15335 [Proteobacteria bacterium]|nr:hypothetical protein [Pseudomonadota bacterium]
MKPSEKCNSSKLLKIYGLVWLLLPALLIWLSRFFPKLRPQLEGRRLEEKQLLAWAVECGLRPRCAIFFCSSAGEYEQAKPLMTRLRDSGEYYVLVILVSISGQRFARSQQEDLPLLLAPWDQPKVWQKLFAALRPDFFVVVRYELWPGFFCCAQSWAPIYLVDAVRSPGLERPGLPRLLRRWLVGKCRGIFAVAATDQDFYVRLLPRAKDKIYLVGDTKYDRVLERLQERENKRLELASQLAEFVRDAPILILGSAWPKDLDVLLSVYSELQALRPGIKLILAPHDVGSSMVAWMEAQLQAHGLRVCRAQKTGLSQAAKADEVLLIDQLGLLPELYALADIAWIGGALHFRVHNVLEAACQGLFICFGPLYHTSQEATQLVSSGLAKVIESGADFLHWVRDLHWEGRPPCPSILAAVLEHRGASERILQKILTDQAQFIR